MLYNHNTHKTINTTSYKATKDGTVAPGKCFFLSFMVYM